MTFDEIDAETAELLADPVAMAELRSAEVAVALGDVVRGVEAARELLRDR